MAETVVPSTAEWEVAYRRFRETEQDLIRLRRIVEPVRECGRAFLEPPIGPMTLTDEEFGRLRARLWPVIEGVYEFERERAGG